METANKCTPEAYKKLIEEDLEWLLKQSNGLERDHIVAIVKRSHELEYPEDAPKPLRSTPSLDPLVSQLRIASNLPADSYTADDIRALRETLRQAAEALASYREILEAGRAMDMVPDDPVSIRYGFASMSPPKQLAAVFIMSRQISSMHSSLHECVNELTFLKRWAEDAGIPKSRIGDHWVHPSWKPEDGKGDWSPFTVGNIRDFQVLLDDGNWWSEEDLKGDGWVHEPVPQKAMWPGKCVCFGIIAESPSRHFKECPMRDRYPTKDSK